MVPELSQELAAIPHEPSPVVSTVQPSDHVSSLLNCICPPSSVEPGSGEMSSLTRVSSLSTVISRVSVTVGSSTASPVREPLPPAPHGISSASTRAVSDVVLSIVRSPVADQSTPPASVQSSVDESEYVQVALKSTVAPSDMLVMSGWRLMSVTETAVAPETVTTIFSVAHRLVGNLCPTFPAIESLGIMTSTYISESPHPVVSRSTEVVAPAAMEPWL